MSDTRIYKCAVCLKRWQSGVKPPVKWGEHLDKIQPVLREGERIVITGLAYTKNGPFVCGEECLEVLIINAKINIKEAMEDLEQFRNEL